jgi:hypothetical protein
MVVNRLHVFNFYWLILQQHSWQDWLGNGVPSGTCTAAFFFLPLNVPEVDRAEGFMGKAGAECFRCDVKQI